MSRASEISISGNTFDPQIISDVWASSKSKKFSNKTRRVVNARGRAVKSETKFLSKALNKRILENVTKGSEVISEIRQKCKKLEAELIKKIANNPKYGARYLNMMVQPDGKIYIKFELELIKMLWILLDPYRRWFNVTPDLIVKIHKNCPPEINARIIGILSSLAERYNVEIAYFNAGKDSGLGFVYHYSPDDVSDEVRAMFPGDDMREQFPDYILDLVDECIDKTLPGKKFTLSSMTHWDDSGTIRITVPTNLGTN